MPFKSKDKDKQWHRLYMRRKRTILRLNSRFVTPSVTPKVDADGYPLPDYNEPSFT